MNYKPHAGLWFLLFIGCFYDRNLVLQFDAWILVNNTNGIHVKRYALVSACTKCLTRIEGAKSVSHVQLGNGDRHFSS